MIGDILISILFLILQALTDMNVREVMNTPRELRGLIFNSDIVQFILTTSMILFTVLSIVIFIFFGWKVFVILFVTCYLMNYTFFGSLILRLLIKILDESE